MKSTPSDVESKESLAVADGGAWRIVIAHSSEVGRAEVQRLLLAGSTRQYEFTEVATGAAAIALIRAATHAPNCVVLNHELVDMDALGVLSGLTGPDEIPICAAVVLTGSASNDVGRAALRAGAEDYVGDAWMGAVVLTRAVENASQRWAMAHDLRERLAAARLAEQHYQALATATADIAYRMSADWSTMLPLDGRDLVSSTESPLVDWAWLHQNIPRDEHARVLAAINQAIETKSLFELEHRLIRPSGHTAWAHSRAVPILDLNQNVIEWFGAAKDVTERKSTAEALARSEAFALSVVEASADCVKGLSLDGHLLWMNENGKRQMEVTDFAAIEGCEWGSYWDAGGIRPEAEAALSAARAGGVGRFSGHCPTLAGRPRWWDVTVTAIHDSDGRIEQFLSVSRDVTEYRAAEAASKLSANRMELALKCSSVALFQQDLILRYTWIYNPALGFNDAQVVGKLDSDLFERAEDAEITEAVKRDVIRSGIGQKHEILVHHQGAVQHFHLLVEPLTDDSGKTIGVTCAAIDITDMKLAEKTLSEQDVRKDEFLATLSHELRNPLAAIRSGVSVLQMTRKPEQGERVLGIIDRQLRHLVHLVDDLLDISRVRSGKITLRPQRVVVGEVIDAAVEACRLVLDRQDQTLEVVLPSDILVVLGDQTRLVQIVSNLLTNSAKYSEPGGRITVRVHRDQRDAVIEVTDTGVGISADTLPTLWDMFTQVRDTIHKAQGGLGIGLSLVKRLVELHGGTVTAESAGVGQGSTFRIRLPLEVVDTSTSADVALSPSVTAAHKPTRGRVLVVDDNLDAVMSVAMLLEISGYETHTAHDGPEALTAAESLRPQVLLLDIGLPTMDGYEVAQKIRIQPWGASMVLIALTGWGQDEHRRQSKAAGFDFHLVKPVDHDALLKLLAEVVAPKRDAL